MDCLKFISMFESKPKFAVAGFVNIKFLGEAIIENCGVHCFELNVYYSAFLKY